MVEKKILIVSPIKKLIKPFFNNTLKKLNLPRNLKFVELKVDYPEDVEIKNIYLILLSLENFSTYKSVIILYPKDEIKYKYSKEEFLALNKLLYSDKFYGVVICEIDSDGQLESGAITKNVESYLLQVSKK